MKKIFLLFAAVCVFAACDPVSEDIGNGGHITADELKAMSTVTVDKAASGKNGNVITCSTSAPVNAKWDIGGKEFVGNYAWKKMKLGSYTVTLTALCADGTELTAEFPIDCQEVTDPLQKFYIFGGPDNTKPAILKVDLKDGNYEPNGAYGRFSDGEGQNFPYLSDDIFFGFKTLIFDITDVQPGDGGAWGMGPGPAIMRVMSGWWDGPYMEFEPTVGLFELPITEKIANDCAQGATGHDLDLMMTRGSVTIKSVYYEE